MLKLDRRQATIGSSINTRTEKHGDTDVAALDIPLSKISLSAEELADVTLVPNAHKFLYAKKRNRPDQPIFGRVLGAMSFKEKIKGVTVTLYLGRKVLKLPEVNLSGCRLELQDGGTTLWSFKIQCTPDLDDSIEALLGKLNQEVEVAIECEGYGAQEELPLEEDDAPETEAPNPRRGRAPRIRADIDG